MKSNSSLMSSILQYAMEGKLVSQKNDNANSFDFLSSFLKKKSKKITRVIFENNNYYEIVDGKKECVSDEISVKIPPS
ncbi:hypothetical protein J6P59_00325 [bacterium]|nr:hypothetical protein [bacterium]